MSDCTNSACAIGLVMIIFHSLLQIFWPSFAFCGIKKTHKFALFMGDSNDTHLNMLVASTGDLQHPDRCLYATTRLRDNLHKWKKKEEGW